MDQDLIDLMFKKEEYEQAIQRLNGIDLEDRIKVRDLARSYLRYAGWSFRLNAGKDDLIRMLLEQCLTLWGRLLIAHARNRGCWP